MSLLRIASLLVLALREACAFQAPTQVFSPPISCAGSHGVKSGLTLHALPTPSSSDVFSSKMISNILVAADDVGLDEAFKDDVDYFGDSTVQLMFGIFAAVIALLAAVNALLGQMDGAIRNVLSDFEKAVKAKYPSRWLEIEEQLEGLDEEKKTEALMKIMERLEREEPKLMERVNAEINSYT